MHAGSPAAAASGAPSLYVIVAIKLGKGLLLLLVALGIYSLSDNNLQAEFQTVLTQLHLDPENRFLAPVGHSLARVTPANLFWVAGGTVFYSSFCLVEGIGLLLRLTWAGYLAIGESLFFIPIEVTELHRHFTVTVVVILAVNIWIACYLFKNRHRLFRHHHP